MRVLCFSEKWESGGIEAFLTGVFEHMDLSDFQIELVTCQYQPGIYDERLARLGIRVRELSGSVRKLGENLRLFQNILVEGDAPFDAVHLNLYEGTALLFARAARKAGVPQVIAHSHSTDLHPGLLRVPKLMVNGACARMLAGEADVRLAPSAAAAAFLFAGAPWELLKNGIEPERFAFDLRSREEVRSQLGLPSGVLLAGIVGRLVAQKNQAFLLEVLAGVPRVHLLVVGEGEDEAMLRARAGELGLGERVHFWGATSQVARMYSAIDVLCVPSLFEGLGIVAVEGQAAGLPVLASPAVPPEAQATGTLRILPLQVDTWREALSHVGPRELNSPASVAASGYDIRLTATRLAALYRGDA